MRSTAQRAPDPWGTSQPHNAYMETPIAQRMIVGHETRLESGQITTKPVFHESIKNSPKNLVSPDKMITLEIIAHSLPGFNPVYPPLNDFEKYCKDNWGKLPVCDMGYFIFAFLMHVHRLADQLKPLSLTVQRKLFGHQSTGLVQSYIALLIDRRCLEYRSLANTAVYCRPIPLLGDARQMVAPFMLHVRLMRWVWSNPVHRDKFFDQGT